MRVFSILPKSNTLLKQGHLRRIAQTASSWVFTINKDGESTISPGNLCQCSTKPHSKEGFSCVSSFMCVLTKLIPSEINKITLKRENKSYTYIASSLFSLLRNQPSQNESLYG